MSTTNHGIIFSITYKPIYVIKDQVQGMKKILQVHK